MISGLLSLCTIFKHLVIVYSQYWICSRKGSNNIKDYLYYSSIENKFPCIILATVCLGRVDDVIHIQISGRDLPFVQQ